jgi:hypothetical protein
MRECSVARSTAVELYCKRVRNSSQASTKTVEICLVSLNQSLHIQGVFEMRVLILTEEELANL